MAIANKTVLITGSNRGIGRALVEEALKRGAKRVYAGARKAIPHPDKRVTPITLDVTNASQIQRAVTEIDTLDILVNNAGIAIYDDLSNFEVIEQHLAVNFFGPLNISRAFLPLLTRSKGAIVNNLSCGAGTLADYTCVLHFEGSRLEHDAITESNLGRPRSIGPCRHARPHRHRYEPGF
jgi:NAD(P)-dependent dehydrogenase (short-subunit alcohol dehydrogenase family)